jgi:hypothetical protein
MKQMKRISGLILMFTVGLIVGIFLDSLWFRENLDPRHGVRESSGHRVSEGSRSGRQGSRSSAVNHGEFVESSSEAEMKRMGILFDTRPVDYQLLGEDGEVNSFALDAAGLRYGDRDKVKKIVDQSLVKVSEVMALKARLNESESDDGRGYYVYDIPPFASEGNAVVEKLADQLREEYGDAASKALMDGLHSERCFAGFGKFESRVVFDDYGSLVNKLNTNGPPQFTLTLKDSKTGRIISSLRSTKPSLLKANLGTAFVEKTKR